MVGGDEERQERRGPWRWSRWWLGLFVLVVAGLRLTAVGGADAPAAGADTATDPVADDGDPTATERLTWIPALADPLESADAALACVRAGSSCAPDDLLAVDTTAARAGSLAAALRAATDPADAGYLGPPAAAVAARAEATATAGSATEEALARWAGAGCGGSVEGVPVAEVPAGCDEWADEAVAALDAFRQAVEAWGS